MSLSAPTDYLNPETAKHFIETVFGEYDGDGFIEFRLLHDGKPLIQKFIPIRDTLAHFPEILAKLRTYNDQGANIYVGILPRDREEGTAAAVSRCRLLWVDVDRKSTADLVDRFNKIIGMGLAPSFVIETGGGVHGYWILRDTHTPQECEKAMAALARHLGGDRVWDAPRIMRLPATFNQKIKGTPRPCYVFKNTGKTYSLSDFDQVITTAPAPTQSLVAGKLPATKNNGHRNGNGHHHDLAQALAPFWREGLRHNLAIGTAGMLKQVEFDRGDAETVIREIAALAGDTEIDDRMKAVETTYNTERDVAGASLIDQVLGEEGSRYTRILKESARRRPPKPVRCHRFPEFNPEACTPIIEGFFQKYLAYAYNCTDAPLQYAAASAATIAAAALGNRVWTTYPQRTSGIKLFPTLYTMLAAKTSRYRKSTSISIARNVTRAVSNIDVFSNNATPEQLFVRMAPDVAEVEEITDRKGNVKEVPVAWRGSPAGIIFHPEFSAILATSKKSYMADLFSLYTDLYDGTADGLTSSRETKSSGRYFINEPAISMLVGVTPAGLRNHLEKTSMSDGFMTRFFYVLSPPGHKTRDPWNQEDALATPEERTVALAQLIDDLTRLRELAGEMSPTLEAATVHQTFNQEIDRRIEEYERDGSEGMDALIARLPTMAVKLSMIYSCATGAFPAITADASQLAVGFCIYIADTAESFYSTMRPEDRNRDAGYVRNLLDLLRRMGETARGDGISHRVLLQRAHLDSMQFDRAIDTLVKEGRVLIKKGPLGGSIYVLNEVED